MTISPFLIRHANWISQKILRPSLDGADAPEIRLPLENHVIIGGFGRLGSTIAWFLENNGIPYIAVENDIDLVDKFRKRGKQIVFGDSNNLEILNRCHLDTARLIVLTFKSLEQGKAAVTRIRQRNDKIAIIVRCQDQSGFEELVSLGASHVFPELLESSLLISRHVLEMLSVNEPEIEIQISEYRENPPISMNS